jgi:hypothetical protein
MHYGSAPWLGIPRLWCRDVCKNYRIKETILQGLCYGCFRIFQRKIWKNVQSHRGQSGQQGTVSFLKLTKRALSTLEGKLSFFFESTTKQRLPTVLYKVLFCVSEWEVLFFLLVFLSYLLCVSTTYFSSSKYRLTRACLEVSCLLLCG